MQLRTLRQHHSTALDCKGITECFTTRCCGVLGCRQAAAPVAHVRLASHTASSAGTGEGDEILSFGRQAPACCSACVAPGSMPLALLS